VTPSVADGPLATGLTVLALVVFGVACLAAFAWRRRRHRDFTHGLRGHAVIADVRPTSAMQRRSVTEVPTETVIVATADLPRGVATGQKFPRGTFVVGQVVPVVQRPGDACRILVDVPGQAPSAFAAYGYLAGAVGAAIAIAIVVTSRV